MAESTNINDFMKALRLELLRVEDSSPRDNRVGLGTLFREAMDNTIDELKRGADVEEFYMLTLANFIVISAEEGYTKDEIATFGKQFQEIAEEYGEEE